MKHKSLIQIIFFIIFLLPINTFAGEWTVMNSPTLNLVGIWGNSGSDVFVVENAPDGMGDSSILHYNGSAWSVEYSLSPDFLFSAFSSVWGNSGSNVFVGTVYGYYWTLLRYDGISWSFDSKGCGGKCYTAINGIWGSSGSDVFAIGQISVQLTHVITGPFINHYDGTSWTEMMGFPPDGSSADLYGVWGSSGSDVFAVGSGGTILHYNGGTWSSMTSGTTNYIYGIWGSSGSDVFAAGSGGTILHYNGSTWSSMASGTTNNIYGIWGSSGSDVFAVGSGGTILHYNGSAWSAMTSGTTNLLRDIWGSSGSDVFAVGNGIILHYTSGSTLIELASFTAAPKSRKVILNWSTESEIDNAGFNLYRSETADGEYTKINASLVPAQGFSTKGASYEFSDDHIQNRKTYYYKLEDIDLKGTSTFHGPVSATPRLIYGLK
jgi:hypothetical protein